MKYLLIMFMLIAAAQVTASGVFDVIESLAERAEEASVSSEIEVVELFHAQTPEELEAALTDGYPMPWLEDILSDESIPEEDRYWLDCRMRAAIAQDLHLFFDRDGNPVHYEADWIIPSEDYCRESFIIASPDRESNSYQVDFEGSFGGRPGIILDSHGDRIGEIAISGLLLSGSKDGSLFATSINRISGNAYRLILLYSDGSYFVSPIEMSYGRCGISQSGEYVILAAKGKDDPWGTDDIPPRAILLDRSGEIIWERELELTPVGNFVPVISPDDRYCAVVSQASSAEDRLNLLLQVLDMETGQEVWRLENPTGYKVRFSPDGRTIFIPGHINDSYAVEVANGEKIWSDQRISTDALVYTDIRYLKGTNNAEFLTAVIRPPESTTEEWFLTLFDNNGHVLAVDDLNSNMDISPNGIFVVSGNYRSGSIRSVIIRKIIKDSE